MTWIKTILPDEADGSLRSILEATRALFPAEYHRPVAAVDESHGGGIVQSHTLIPQALHHAFGLLGVLLSSELPLQRRQHEMIATVVSSANRCFY